MGVRSVDRFVREVADLVVEVTQVIDVLANCKSMLSDVTGFNRVREARLKHIAIGGLLQMFAAANGDVNKVKV